MELISINTIYRMKNGVQQEIPPNTRFKSDAAEAAYLIGEKAATKYVAVAAPVSVDEDVDADDSDVDTDVDADEDGDAADDLVG